MRYPIGFFGFVCGFTLIGARGILTKISTAEWFIYLCSWFLFLRFTHVRIFSKKFLLNFIVSLAVAAHMMFICTRQPTRGRYVRGVFQFDKLFRTQPKRIGGIGQLMVSAISQRDMPLLQSSVVFSTMIIIIGNLVADILYSFLDPKIRTQ